MLSARSILVGRGQFGLAGGESLAVSEDSSAHPFDCPAHPMRIAIVNDSDALLRTLRVCFEAHGHQTLTVAIWEIRFPHLELPQVVTAFRPDVLVYDIGMPFTSSWDFYCIVREISDLKHIPTVLTTANSAAMHRQLELRIQAYEVTGTPDNLDGLLALVSATAVRESDD